MRLWVFLPFSTVATAQNEKTTKTAGFSQPGILRALLLSHSQNFSKKGMQGEDKERRGESRMPVLSASDGRSR